LQTPTGPPDADAPQDNMKNKPKTRQTSDKTSLALSAMLLLTALQTANAGTTISELSGKEPSAKDGIITNVEPSIYDKLWSLATLYKDDSNSFIQELKLRGRYHGQYHWLDSDQGSDDGWEDRRIRLGIEGKLFNKKVEFRAEFQSADEFDPFYQLLTDVYLKWKPSEAFNVTVGKQKPQVGAYDWLPSTNFQPTFERSQIFNQLKVDRAPGIVVDGKIAHWTYQAGIYSNQVDREFGQFDGGVSFSAGIGFDLKDALNTEKADLRVDYLHSEIDPNDTLLNRYENIFSATLWLKEGRWSLVTEAFAGTGRSGKDGDVIGFFILPTYDVIPKKLQLVGRYTFSAGDGADSVIAQTRYERAAPELTGGGRGDQYQAADLGIQYFIYGDRLKLLAGAEYSQLNGGGNGGDYDGWTALTGIRFSF
jgi:phosphate-selective porin OprO and OprP